MSGNGDFDVVGTISAQQAKELENIRQNVFEQ
jgi:hypothetical protein